MIILTKHHTDLYPHNVHNSTSDEITYTKDEFINSILKKKITKRHKNEDDDDDDDKFIEFDRSDSFGRN